MNTTEQTVLALLRHALWNEPIMLPQVVDWAAVYAELKSHAVHTLVDQALMNCCSEKELRQAWQLDMLKQYRQNDMNRYGQVQALALLEQAGIPAVVLKGTAAAQYYPCPLKRILGDVDILVSAKRHSEALRLLIDNSFVQEETVSESKCDVPLVKENVLFELHRGVLGAGKRLTRELEAALSQETTNRKQCAVEQDAFPALTDHLNGMVLLLHMRNHLTSGLGLRQIIDWMMYVSQELDDERWQNGFQAFARENGLEKLAIVSARMCQLWLGLTEQNRTWCQCANENVCGQLLCYVMEGGNFGQKVGHYASITQNMMMQKHFAWRMLTNLQAVGLEQRELVQKHTALRPFAWLIQLVYYARHTLKRGNPMQVLFADAQKAHMRRPLFEALGIIPVRTKGGRW